MRIIYGFQLSLSFGLPIIPSCYFQLIGLFCVMEFFSELCGLMNKCQILAIFFKRSDNFNVYNRSISHSK